MSSTVDMRRRDLVLLYVMALALFGAVGTRLASPGYMDAEYYLSTGQELAGGGGFHEPFLWNYLDDPVGIPHPSHRYWMPLASLLSAAGIYLAGNSFRAAQLPFLLMAAGLPVLTYALAWRLYGDAGRARKAGMLALAPGLFLPFLLTTDTFGLFALVGGGALMVMAGSPFAHPRRAAFAGALVGLAHLARADGVLLWLPLLAAAAASPKRRLALVLSAALGYAIVLSPWLARNLIDTGSLWPPGGTRTLWLLSYDETFTYPASLLTPSRWWAAGLPVLLGDRMGSLWTNLRSLVVVNGLVFLAPLMAAGAWRKRREPVVRTAGLYLAVLLFVMSFIFPYAGPRGGFFHSSAALMPLFFALAPEGLGAFVDLGVRTRGWLAKRSSRLFFGASLALASAFTIWATWSRMTADGLGAGWERNGLTFAQAAGLLPDSARSIAANDPPGLYLASGLPAVVIPNGDPDALRAVIQRYDIDWVLLELNHPHGLDSLYDQPAATDILDAPIRFEDADGAPAYLFPVRR